ncbi:MAG TPA: hypothetical protein DCP28_24615 [Cytophagales bacterium]|nr:hypothetical protein [Cytophagales bacterium]
MAQYLQPNGPGLSLSIMRDGETLYTKQQGYANLEHQVPITDSTVFLVASISKQFTAFSALLLQEQGLLDMDDYVGQYLPELEGIGQQITLRQLANHTSGLRNTYDLNRLRGRGEQDMITMHEMIDELLRQRGLNFTPGERFQYNNAGFALLAEVVGRVSGLTYAEFVQQHIFVPLGMHQSRFVDLHGTLLPHKANSYQRYGDTYYHIPINRTVVGSTGLYTTPNDLLKWAHNYQNAVVGTADMFAEMIIPTVLNSGERSYYGLGMETRMHHGVQVIFHGGGDAAYRSYLLQVPEYGFSLAVSGNYEAFNPLDLAYGMIDIFLADHITKTETVIPQYTTQELQKYEGTYQIFPGLYLEFVAQDDSLYFRGWGDEGLGGPLPTMGEGVFSFPYLPKSRMVFTQDQVMWHLSDFFYPGKRVPSPTPPAYEDLTLSEYEGSFYSEELQTTYTIVAREGQLVVTHPVNQDLILTPIAQDAFITNESFLARVEYLRDASGQITDCLIHGQDAWDIPFRKISLD